MDIIQTEILEVVTQQLIMIMELEEGELEISMQTRFQDDLELESIEMIALGDSVKIHYKELTTQQSEVDFAGWLSQLTIEQLMDLSVGDLVNWLAQVLNQQ